jgi:NTE family protein
VKLLSKYIIIIAGFIFLTSGLYAQKVGLVLSGGGAKGVVHIGALRALEENNIPIDYIAGTSMGAIVGAMYASGYSPDEIQKLISSDEMKKWINGDAENEYSSFYNQPEPTASWQKFKLSFDSSFRIKIPANIITPYEMDFGFMELFSGPSAAANYNFDSLMVPFRCIVADVSESRPLIMKSGDLGQAVRASATFPFYFKPIKIDGKLMFDGGMYNNFPVDVMENDFAPDYIIGIKAASPYGPPEENDLVSQIQSMLMRNTNEVLEKGKGIIIKPETPSIGITDFSNTPAFIDSGYIATMRKVPEIKKFIKRRVSSDIKNIEREVFAKKIPRIKIGNIKITGISKRQQIYVEKLLSIDRQKKQSILNNLPDSLVLDELKKKYKMLIADENVEYVYPQLIFNDSSEKYDVELNVKRGDKVQAEIGGLVSSQATNEIFFQIQYNYWAKKALSITANTYLGRFHNSGYAQVVYGIPGKLPVSIHTSYTLNGWNYFNTNTYFFEDEKPNYLVENDSYGRFSIGTPVSQHSRFGACFATGRQKFKYYQTNQFSRTDTADISYFNFYSPAIEIESNTLKRKQFESKGSDFKICARFVGGLEHTIPGSTVADTVEAMDYHKWVQLKFSIDSYFLHKGIFSLGLYAEAVISNHPLFNNYTASLLVAPSFQPLPQMSTIFLSQFRAYNYGGLGLKAVFNIFKNFDFRAEGYIFQPYQEILKDNNGDAYFGVELSSRNLIGSGCLVYHAPFGPVSMSLNYYEGSEEPFNFNINIGYLIFNKKPLE